MKRIFKTGLSFALACMLTLQPMTSYAAEITLRQTGDTTEVLNETTPIEASDESEVIEAFNDAASIEVLTVDESVSETNATPQLTNLPVVYITTEENAEITSKDYYLNAKLIIRDGDTELYNGATEIKGRGNSTWGLPKKPYRLKLDEKTDLFNMGKNKHWVLLANYYDKSLMRNKLSYDLSGVMGMDQMESVWVDVVLNDKYIGNYQLCEHVRVGDDRVEVMDWEDITADVAKAITTVEPEINAGDLEDYMNENMSWITDDTLMFKGKTYTISDYYQEYIDISGGYLIELDSYMDEVSTFYTDQLKQPLMLKVPEFLATNEKMMNYLKTYFGAFEAAITNDGTFDAIYNNETVHYTDLFDMDSLIDYWLVQELFFNEDAMKKSTYMHKDTGEPVEMGPVWDMDWAANAYQSSARDYDQWQTKYFNGGAQKDQWYKYIVQDSYFMIKARERYLEIRDTLIEDMIKDGGSIDTYITYLKDSGANNDAIWPNSPTFASESQNLKTWLINHVNWLDKQFATKESLFNSLSQIKESSETITLQLEDGTALESTESFDGILPENSALKVTVSSAKSGYGIFINSKLFTSVTNDFTSVVIPYADALPFADETNVITVKYLNNGEYDNSEVITATYTNGKALPVITTTAITCTAPAKTEYKIGETLDITGLKVQAVMSDGSTIDVTDSAELSALDSSAAGTKTITVTYNGFTTSFDVTVLKESPVEEKDTEAPTVPKNIQTDEIKETSVKLSWEASTDNVGVMGYQILVDGKVIGTVKDTTATILDLKAATNYLFEVKAYDEAENYSAALSLSATTAEAQTEPTTPEKPNKPSTGGNSGTSDSKENTSTNTTTSVVQTVTVTANAPTASVNTGDSANTLVLMLTALGAATLLTALNKKRKMSA